ncbi:unnamed protein product [Blepharisma stoltei]|uniref:Uncharacterized protein n=1 Tax=Blepharisma stoltei TaxID=1481888 RepID=A0AAU9JBG3_9CILI|nr:unnamed protein product [Blepharisma stoltei]
MIERIKSLTPDLKSKAQKDVAQMHRNHESKVPELPVINKQLDAKKDNNIRSSSTLRPGKNQFIFSSRHHEKQVIGETRSTQRIKLKPINLTSTQNTVNSANEKSISPIKIREQLSDREKKDDVKIYEILNSFGGLSIKITSATIEYFNTRKKIIIPFNDLPYVLYENSEIKIAGRIKKFTNENEEWENNVSGISLVYMSLPLDYPYSVYRYKFERVLVMLTPNATRENRLEEIKIKLFSKGLMMKYHKIVILTPEIIEKLFSGKMQEIENRMTEAMCWEGFEALNVIQNLRENGGNLTEFLLWHDVIATKINAVFSDEEIKSWDFPIQKQTILFGHSFCLTLPMIIISIGSFSQEISVPLGLLKRFLQDNFVSWISILMSYLYSHNSLFLIGNKSIWISFVNYQGKDSILVFKAPELLFENHEINVKHEFSIRDISQLLEISANKKSDFLRFIISKTTIESGLKDQWKIHMDLGYHNYSGNLSYLKNIDEEIEFFSDLKVRCQFKLPIVEIYMMDTNIKDSRIVKNETCQILASNGYQNWDRELLDLFDR